MSGIILSDVRKSYGSIEVIHGLSIDIVDGELIVIVGPSGCGKSTLLRMVAGLETITSGEVTIDGRLVNNLEPRARDIAMVFQNYALYPHMSVYDNMAYGLRIAGMAKADIRARVEQAAAMLALSAYLNRKPRQLSGGQRQRVAMGRAIVREPAAFLFDEPLSNLDAKLRVQMRMEIKQLQQKLGVTALYVTHDQVEAMTMADRMIVMNEGIAEQIGPPSTIYEQPASLFVAEFIGAPPMNIFGLDEIVCDFVAKLGMTVPDDADKLGIRPEHLMIVAEDAPAYLAAQVTFEERLGAEILSHVKCGHGDNATVRTEAGKDEPVLGDQVYLSALPQHLHFFDRTGKRLNFSHLHK